MLSGMGARIIVSALAALLAPSLVGCFAELGNVPSNTLPADAHAKPSATEAAENPCANHDLTGCMRACRADDAKACNLVGVLFEFDPTRQEPGLASGFYKRGCDESYYPACNNLAWLYLSGRGVPQDKPQAMRLFYFAYDAARTACVRGDVSGCMMAGDLLENGRGVDADEAQAVAMFDRACAGGEPQGCERAELLR
jgi:TPR repeat protein